MKKPIQREYEQTFRERNIYLFSNLESGWILNDPSQKRYRYQSTPLLKEKLI